MTQPSGGTHDILIVDDTPANLHLLSEMLTQRGYRVRAVTSGSRALASAQLSRPDLILLDIKMPEMNGYQVCQQLKSNAQTREAPVIFISALDELQDKVHAFAVGGVDYITKPFQVEEVVARVETHLALRRLQEQLEHANQKMTRELALAGQVQASFLPAKMPHIPGWQLAVTLKPARETSGDFYDVHLMPDGKLGLLIADVVDKGVGAALYMALCWALIRAYAAEYSGQPDKVLTATNRRILTDTGADQFVSVFYAVIEPASGKMVYCNAGHPSPYVVRGEMGGAVTPLTRTGMILGVLEEETWLQGSLQLAPGDALVLYTDGLTEAQDVQGSFFGQERLLALLRAHRGHSAEEIRGALLRSLDDFTGDAVQGDDLALVVAVREPV
jgi:sigma-B regulation protein RsbU (phosphoserine phosphatase)